ncbi:MAG: hypothetical protein JXM79_05975 [Sedimentisphaerales bacterium]|nr:hypothetical protein [Sedimentisphaerales bacterium]
MINHRKHSITNLYYYITPLFILLDYLFGINIRVTVLDSMPHYKYVYYGFCIFCGVGMYILPRCTPIVALFESTLNILLVVLTVFLPYIKMVSQFDNILEADWQPMNVFTLPHIINLILAGTVATFAFYGSLRVLGVMGTDIDSDDD